MSHNILLTGASGYLGGTLLSHLSSASLSYSHLYALVRNDSQASAVKRYGAEPLVFNPYDATSVKDHVVEKKIDVVFFLIDAFKSESQGYFLRALAAVKKETGREVHFLHTSGAKIFSSHCGAPTDRPLLDNDPKLYDVQKSQRAVVPMMQKPIETNNTVITLGEHYGVRSYIFVPCIVYGKGEGFGNSISIQTTAIVEAAKSTGKVYKVDEGRPTWPVSHVRDTAALYISILRNILSDKDIDHGRNGYYLAASGSVAWDDLYSGIAKSMLKRGVVSDDTVTLASDEALEQMAVALGSPKEMVAPQLGGCCTFTAKHGAEIGWKAEYPAGHILETIDEEVALVLEERQK